MKKEETKFYEWIGSNIARARKNANLSQEELAKKLNRSRASIANIERGKQTPPLFVFWVIAKSLEINIQDILPINNEHLILSQSDIIKKMKKIKDLDDSDKAIFSKIFE